MGGNNLSININAETVDFASKLAVARQNLNELNASLRQLAAAEREAIAAGNPMSEALQQAASDALKAQNTVNGLKAELATASGGMTQLGHAAEGAHGGINGVIRESRALFDELSSGRAKQSPATALLLAQNLYKVSPAAFGAVAGVAALAVGLGALALRAVSASNALNQMDLAAQTAGNNINRGQFQQLSDDLAKLPAVSQSAAREIVGALAGVPGMTFGELDAAARLASQQMVRTGHDAKEVGESYAKMLSPFQSAEQVYKDLGILDQALADEAIKADRSQNINEIAAEKLKLIASQADRTTNSLATEARTWMQWAYQQMAAIGAANAGLDVVKVQAEALNENTSAWNANIAAAKKGAEALASGPATKLPVLDKGSVLDQMRDQIQKLAATWDGAQSGMLAKQIQIAQTSLGEVQKGSKEYLAIKDEEARLEIQYRRAAGEESIAAAREQVARIGAQTQESAVQRLQVEQALWQGLLNGDRLNATQREQVQRTLAETTQQIAREQQSEAQQIEKISAAATLAIARQDLEAKKAAAQADFDAYKIKDEQKLAIDRQLVQQETDLDVERLQAELQTLQQQPVEAARVSAQIREIKAKEVTDLALLDKQYQADAARNAKEQVSAWRGAVNEIESVEGSLVSNLLSGRQTLSQTLAQAALQLAEKEIAADLKAVTTRLLLSKGEQTQKMAMEQGGLLFHLASEGQQTATTTAGVGARTAAVVAGNTAQTASTISSAAAGKAASAAAGRTTVMQDAAKAFSGTYASVAQIPYVGWILAPAAATAAFTAVAAYEGLASLDVGAWDVPRDMVAQIHQGEMVVPRNFSEGLRANMSGEGGGQGGYSENHTYNGGIHISAFDSRSMARALGSSGGRSAIVAAATRYVRRGGGRGR